MTMRDEIKEILTQPLYVTDPDECRQKASGIQLTRILAIFQKRLDEITVDVSKVTVEGADGG